MNINDLYKRLDKIFVEHTTYQWKNGWNHEGNRLSKELTIQKNIPWYNLFLLQKSSTCIRLEGPQDFRIEVDTTNDIVRVDIEAKQISDIDIYYYIDNEMDWLATSDFIVDLCQKVYDSHIKLKEAVSNLSGVYGVFNPDFIKPFRRERQLNELGI